MRRALPLSTASSCPASHTVTQRAHTAACDLSRIALIFDGVSKRAAASNPTCTSCCTRRGGRRGEASPACSAPATRTIPISPRAAAATSGESDERGLRSRPPRLDRRLIALDT